MLHYIKGQLAMKIDGGVVVERDGIGYEIFIPENSAIYLAHEGDEIMLYLYMAVREDDISLYGFYTKEELDLFKQLITVTGVGAKAAMAILSAMPLDECVRAIVFEDATMLTRANGIGKKIAQRIVLELHEKVKKIDISLGNANISGVDSSVHSENKERNEAINALIALGYSKGEATNAMAAVTEEELTSEQYIKKALRQLF